MKPLIAHGICGALIALGLTLTARAQNPCMDGVTYGPWSCSYDGSIASHGTLTGTNFSVCAGGTLTAPGLATNPTFNNGQETAEVFHSCYPTEDGPTNASVIYTAGSLYFVPTNSGWPSITGPFNTPGTYVYQAFVNGNPSFSGCDVITDQVATVFVVVSASPPVIITQPTNQTVYVGDNAVFAVSATGCPVANYQWWFNATNQIVGATNFTLFLGNVQLTNAGLYSVVVSDFSGSVTSSAALLTVDVPSCLTPPSDIVSWWPGEGNANDIIGTNNGIQEGPVGFTNGEVNQAFFFNNTNAYIKIPASASLNVGASNGLTIEGWINPLDVTQQHCIAEWNNGTNYWGVHFYISQDAGPGSLYANVVDSGGSWHQLATPIAPVTTNVFQHVALTYDKSSGVAAIYYDGQVVTQKVLGTFTPSTTFDLYLGRRVADTAGNSFAGSIDEMSLYDRALASNEIAAIYDAGSAGKCVSSETPPYITVQPASQTAIQGTNVTFSVTAGGTLPLSYQWLFDGTNLPGATSNSLVLTNVLLSQAGVYSVFVTNVAGNVTSSNAILTVLLPPPYIALSGSLTNYTFRKDTTYPRLTRCKMTTTK